MERNTTASHQNVFSRDIPLDELSEIAISGIRPIIDVREYDEVKVVRIDAKNYVNIPVKEFEAALKMNEELFEETYKIPKPQPHDHVMLICRSGRRSNIAIEIARANNYTNVRHYNEGTNGWMKHFPDRIITSSQ